MVANPAKRTGNLSAQPRFAAVFIIQGFQPRQQFLSMNPVIIGLIFLDSGIIIYEIFSVFCQPLLHLRKKAAHISAVAGAERF